MRIRPAALLLSFLPFAAGPALADEKAADNPASKPAAAAKKAAPSEEEATKAWQAYMTPGEGHRKLASFEGTWAVKVKMWMDPSKPPEESEGTMVSKMVLGGRYLEDRYEGTMMGQPFTGLGYTGYDNYKKKVVGSWMDTAGTGIMAMTGSWDASGKVMTSTGTMEDPVQKRTTKVKSVGTIVDADNHTFEMWAQGPDGKMFKTMEMVYTRKK